MSNFRRRPDTRPFHHSMRIEILVRDDIEQGDMKVLKGRTWARRVLIPWAALSAVWSGVWAPGCAKCLDPPGGYNHNEPIANRRGAVIPDDQSPERSGPAFGRFSSVLIQPLRAGDNTPRNEAYVYALYVQTAYDVGVIGKTLVTALPGPSSSCPPRWRIDVYTPTRPITAYINESCGLLKVGKKFSLYSKPVRVTLGRYLRRAVRKPTHRVIRVRVPAEIPYQKALTAVRARVLRAYLPGGPYSKNPHVLVGTRLQTPLPADLTRLDQAARGLRTRASDFMKRYAQGLLDSRPEVAGFEGPYSVAEAFERSLRVHYQVKVYFRSGTDPLLMRYLSSRLEMHIEEVKVPKFYRIDAVVPVTIKIREIKKMLAKLPIKPPLHLWPMLTRPR